MVPPSKKRKNAWRGGVIQIHVTRACNLSCSNCTQGSQFGGKTEFISIENFEKAVSSLTGYWGVVGVFGGLPTLHPQFITLCEILRSHFPVSQCGLWCNDPLGHGKEMRKTFNPKISNLNVHLKKSAFDEFKRDWPESDPFGLNEDSKHAPVHGLLSKFIPDEGDRWGVISKCAINQNWSSMICQFRGEARAFFCEVAASQAILNQYNPEYPDTGHKVTDGWWLKSMQDFYDQVSFHCHRCLVPLNGVGHMAQTESVTTVTSEYSDFKLKGSSHVLEIIDEKKVEDSGRIATRYIY
jgi:hypothetical protein